MGRPKKRIIRVINVTEDRLKAVAAALKGGSPSTGYDKDRAVLLVGGRALELDRRVLDDAWHSLLAEVDLTDFALRNAKPHERLLLEMFGVMAGNPFPAQEMEAPR